jgi:uncharacterized membrane protein YdjX (TVP38/TMEM64 family)
VASGYPALVLAFLLVELLPIPRTPLAIAAGAVFGIEAAPPILLASTVGGSVGFLLARSVLREPVRRMLARRRLTDALLRAIDLEGVRLLALTRFCSPIPTMVQNFAFGLTRIGFWPFAATTFAATAPQIAFYCYLGAIGRRAAQGELGGPVSLATAALAILCFGTAVLIVRRRVVAILSGASAADRECC